MSCKAEMCEFLLGELLGLRVYIYTLEDDVKQFLKSILPIFIAINIV